MKEKVMYLILGILIGAVITAGVFLMLQKTTRPEMPENFKGARQFNGERPDDKDFENRIKNGEFKGRFDENVVVQEDENSLN